MLAPTPSHAECIDDAPDGTWDYRQGEECDNGTTGAGCSDTCEIETGWTCEAENDLGAMTDDDIVYENYPHTSDAKRDPLWKVDQVVNKGFLGDSPWSNSKLFDPYEIFEENRTTAPILAYSGIDSMTPEYQIGLKNPKNGEDGFMGFALGFNEGDTANPDARYLLIDWKRGSGKGGNEGLRLSVVQGVPTNVQGVNSDFFKKNDGTNNTSSKVRLLAEADSNTTHASDLDSGHYGNTSWKQHEWYIFTVDYTETQLTIQVRGTDIETSNQTIFNLNIADLENDLGSDFDDLFPDGTFPTGDLYYYNVENQDPYFTVISHRGSVCDTICGDGVVVGDETCDGEDNCHVGTCRWTVEIDSPADQDVLFDRQPVVEGQGDVGAEIALTVDGETYTTTVDPDGTWSVPITTDLTPGAQTIVVEQTDVRGGTSTAEVQIEIAEPYITITGPDDGTVYNSNTLPASGTILITGETTPNATVEVFINGSSHGTVTADGNGDWTLEIFAQEDGEYEVTAVSVTPGAPDVEDTINISVDTETEVEITSPADGSSHTDPIDTISGTGEPDSTVVVEINGVSSDPVTVDSDGNWSVDAPDGPLTNDEFTATATITDPAGNTDSSESTFTVHIDACTDGSASCDVNASCQDLGSGGLYECICNPGYTGDGATCLPVFDPTDDHFETTENTPLAWIPEDLLQNDGNADEDSFELLNEDPDNPGTYTTTEGGTITYDEDTGEYVYTPPEDFTGEDSFSYKVCSGVPGEETDCPDVKVTITVNETPVVDEDTTLWVVTSTPNVSIDLNDIYQGATITVIDPTDPVDGDDAPAGNVTTDIPGASLTFTPDDPDRATTYTFDVTIADNAGVEGTGTITIIYNDPPVLADPNLMLEPGTSKTLTFEELVRESHTGDVDGGWDTTSIAVSNNANGPFDQDADLGDDHSCEILDGEFVYFLSDASALEDDGPTCFVQICEEDPGPAGVIPTDRACSIMEVTPTAGIGVEITGPQDQDVFEADDPITVTGTGEPNREVTIEVDGQPVGTTTTDDDGNWSFDLEDPLSPGEHTITAEGENNSTDSVDVIVKDPATSPENIVINGPADGATIPPSTTVYGKAEPFTPVKIYVDGEEVGTVNADGKGAWTFDLQDLELGEHTITAEDRNGETDQITVTVKEDDGNGEGGGNGDLEGADPDVALTGGRFLSCASSGTPVPSTGLVLLTLGVGLALARRRRRTA